MTESRSPQPEPSYPIPLLEEENPFPTSLYFLVGISCLIIPFLLFWPYFQYRDQSKLEDYGVTWSDISTHVYYVSPWMALHAGPAVYLHERREKLLESPHIDASAVREKRDELRSERPVYVYAALGVFLIGVVASSNIILLLSSILTPVAVYVDLKNIQNYVDWGRMRYLHVIAAAIPLFPLIYLFQRSEHIFYTALIAELESMEEERDDHSSEP